MCIWHEMARIGKNEPILKTGTKNPQSIVCIGFAGFQVEPVNGFEPLTY